VLPLGKKNNKKVSYQNHDNKKHTFKVKSSHPKEMEIKTELLAINSGDKGKFAIRFSEQKSSTEKKYILFIKRDGKDFENILLKVSFTQDT
jgi:hypothetical protein